MIKFKRIMAFLVDAVLLFILLVIGTDIIVVLIIVSNPELADRIIQNATVVALTSLPILYLLLCLRDAIGSLGKVIFRLRVYALDGKKATFKQRFLRNITAPIWQVEFVILLILGKRLGDMLAKTTVQPINWRCSVCQEK